MILNSPPIPIGRRSKHPTNGRSGFAGARIWHGFSRFWESISSHSPNTGLFSKSTGKRTFSPPSYLFLRYSATGLFTEILWKPLWPATSRKRRSPPTRKFFRQKEFGAERRWREALDQYRRALAQIHADEGDFAEAVETIRLHSRLFDDPAIFEFYLNILAEEGLFEEGVRALEGDRFRPELLRSPDTLRTAVWVMESGGQRMRALALAEELYELFPDDASVGLTVARLLAETGRRGSRGNFWPDISDPMHRPKYFFSPRRSPPPPEATTRRSDT